MQLHIFRCEISIEIKLRPHYYLNLNNDVLMLNVALGIYNILETKSSRNRIQNCIRYIRVSLGVGTKNV